MCPLSSRLCRSLVRARADAEALEARADAAEAVEAGLQSELRAAEAAGAEAEAAHARCQALEERLSELRAEQVTARLKDHFALTSL